MRSPASDDRRWSRAIASMISAWCAVFSPAWQRSVRREPSAGFEERGRHSSFLSGPRRGSVPTGSHLDLSPIRLNRDLVSALDPCR